MDDVNVDYLLTLLEPEKIPFTYISYATIPEESGKMLTIPGDTLQDWLLDNKKNGNDVADLLITINGDKFADHVRDLSNQILNMIDE